MTKFIGTRSGCAGDDRHHVVQIIDSAVPQVWHHRAAGIDQPMLNARNAKPKPGDCHHMRIRFVLPVAALWIAIALPSMAATANTSSAGKADPQLVTKALQSLYGKSAEIHINKHSGAAVAIWKATPATYAALFPHTETTAEIMSAVKLAAPLEINGTQEYLVLTASHPYSPKPLNICHACKAALGGVLLKNQGGDWTVDKMTLHIADLGIFGRLPEGQLIRIGTNNYAASFLINDTSMGDSKSQMVIFGVVGNELQQLVNFPTEADDTDGTCMAEEGDAKQRDVTFNRKLWCYGYTSNVEFVKADDKAYFDLVVRYTGTTADSPAERPEGLKISDVSRVDTYKWDGKRYALSSSVRSPSH